MITAFFTPYYKFLQKDKYLKFFNDVNSLNDLIDKIKVEDKINIYAYSKDIIKFQFKNTRADVDYVFLTNDVVFDEYINEGNKVKIKVSADYVKYIGEYIYIIQNRDELIKTVEDKDLCCFQATDINELCDNLVNRGEIGDNLCTKMFLTDEQIAEMEKEDVI